MMLGRMNGARKRGRPRQRWLDTLKGYASGATISNMIGWNGEELPRLSPGIGWDSMAQGNNLTRPTYVDGRKRENCFI